MADHWGFVAAAYGVAALVLGGYWRRLARRERELHALAAARAGNTLRNRRPSMSGHPRSEPASRPPLQP
jgi:hypothetical protein